MPKITKGVRGVFIKARPREGKRTWRFLSDGGTNAYSCNAMQFRSAEGAQTEVDKLIEKNPKWEFKVEVRK